MAISPLFFPEAKRSVLSSDCVYYHFDDNHKEIGKSRKIQRSDAYRHVAADGEVLESSITLTHGDDWHHYDVRMRDLGKSLSVAAHGGAYHHFDLNKKDLGYSINDVVPGNSFHRYGDDIAQLGRKPEFSMNCFVATVCFDRMDHPTVTRLRDFRNNTLTQSAAGRLFIAAYNEVGPRVVEFVAEHPKVKPAMRKVLNLAVKIIG